MESQTDRKSDILQTLEIDSSSGRRRYLKWYVIAALIIMLSAPAALALKDRARSSSLNYTTREVRRGDIIVTVTATGNLEATNQITVGSELSGTVKSVEVDYNTRVKAGQVLARLDTSKLDAQNLQYKAALQSASAKLLETQATVRESENNLTRLKRVQELSQNKVPSQYEMDAAKAALDRARADEASARAAISQARANLLLNETDLSKTVIRSPINGIILTRDVEPGQTVAASLQAPVLFTVAEDLTRMELHVDVDEADVGQVREGQEATFTVDAFPNRIFKARITQVRYGATTTDGVVTYETILDVDNSDLLLRPGMTVTADITVQKVENAVLAPNAALRFTPVQKEQKASPSSNRGFMSRLFPHPPRPGRSALRQQEGPGNNVQQRVWTLRNGELVPIPLRVGATDGTMTEVTGGDVKPGMALVVDMAGAKS